MSAELVTLPPAPIVPWVLTVIGPDGGAEATLSAQMPPKMVAGPQPPAAPSAAVTGRGGFGGRPPGGRFTNGLCAVAGALGDCPQPRRFCGPPKSPTFTK